MVYGPLNWPVEVPYDAAVKCIYCGSSNVSGKEHIIPLSLYGDRIIPKGSCGKCARITGGVEQSALRGVYRYVRERLGYPHRHKDIDRSAFPIFVRDASGRERREMIPLAEYPRTGLFYNPRSSNVRLLDSLIVSSYETSPGLYLRVYIKDHQEPALRERGIKEFAHPSLNIFSLYRMLAKIGHSYAVAELGTRAFKPLLLDIILKKARNYEDFIGGTSINADPIQYAYVIQLNNYNIGGVAYIGVLLRIFANEANSPTYEIIVGTLVD